MLKQYNIEGTRDINGNRKDKCYRNPKTWPTYQKDFQHFKNNIMKWVTQNKPMVILRVYDGEFWLLRCRKVGNVGKRHCSKKLTPEFVKKFKEGALKCDKFLSHLTVLPGGKMHDLFKSVFENKKIDYPMEFSYALVINKWIFKTFKNQIGIIAGNEKIKVIKELMKFKKYRDYLGIDYFADYISVPEKHSCDNTEELIKNIGKELVKSKAKVILFGIGICKMAIAYKFKEYHNAIYLDIGGTMSGLAGFLSKHRPYAADWINFRIKDYNYSKVDPIDVTKNENIIYL